MAKSSPTETQDAHPNSHGLAKLIALVFDDIDVTPQPDLGREALTTALQEMATLSHGEGSLALHIFGWPSRNRVFPNNHLVHLHRDSICLRSSFAFRLGVQ